ncbi:universal stress protein [Streptomyces sp. NPDC006551]|uniref:universal stress protein n=1 Tax=Streptomyces sp. NPDC006551 TaxID=3157178 RepID=UPI0033A4A2FB
MSGPRARPSGRRVVVGVSGSLASPAALRHAAVLARREDAEVLAVLAWEPPEGEALFACRPDRSWARMWGEAARTRLDRAVLDGLGPLLSGGPHPPAVARRVVRESPAAALCAMADRPDDLLVLGARPARGRLGRLRPRPVLRAVLGRAGRPVLTVPGPALLPGEARVLRRSADAHAPYGVRGVRI